MSSNAIRGPRRASQTGASVLGERASTPTPASGIRSAPLGPSDPTPSVGVVAVDPGKLHASGAPAEGDKTGSGPRRRYDKVDMGRLQFDSGEMTSVASPNPLLLAIARGERPKVPRRLTWFALGMTVGALAVWCATSDVRGDIFAARVHIASILRSLRGEGEPPPATLVTEGGGASIDQAAHAPAIPTTDVATLPIAKTAPAQATNPATIAAPATPAIEAATPTLLNGAPTLPNAPGPR